LTQAGSQIFYPKGFWLWSAIKRYFIILHNLRPSPLQIRMLRVR